MIELLYIVLGLVSLLYLYLTWNNDYWKKKGIPYPRPLPGFGNMWDAVLFKKSAQYVYVDIYKKFPGQAVCGFFDLCNPCLLARSPSLIQTVLVKEFSNFHDNDFHLIKEVDPYLYKNPFASIGADWKINRAALTPALTASKLKYMFPQMKIISQNMEEHLNGHLSEEIEAKDLSFLFSVDIIANCAFGISGNSFVETDHVFKRMGNKIAEKFHNPFLAFAFFAVPKLSEYLKIRLVPDEVYMFLKDAIMQVDDFRKKNNVVRHDFADFLLTTYNSNKLNEENAEMVMLGHAITFFMEGIETSAITASFMLYELAINPHVQEKLRVEILSKFSKREDIEFEVLQKLPYMHQVVSETLRKYPPGLALRKLCTQSTVLDVEGQPLKVEKGTCIVIPIYALHNDPKYYPDPDKFDPERFSEENISSRPQCSYIPFGEGPRICIGLRFALIQVKLFIISILLKYSVECYDKYPKPLILNQCDMLLSSADGLRIKFQKLSV